MRYCTIFLSLIISLCLLNCDSKIIKEFETGEIPIPAVSSDDPAIVPVSQTSQWWFDRHNDRTNNIKINQKIIFIGDSITQRFEEDDSWIELNQKYNNKLTNLGFSSDCTQNVIWRLENGEFPVGINPEFIVIMIGVNNIRLNNHPESIAAGIGKIVNIINLNSPITKIIIFSVLPSVRDYNYITTSNAVNEIIKKYDGYININYVDIGKYYVDSDGILIDELFTDGVHLTTAGYNIWKEKIIELIPYEDTQQ
jgi:beta-glucosidase